MKEISTFNQPLNINETNIAVNTFIFYLKQMLFYFAVQKLSLHKIN